MSIFVDYDPVTCVSDKYGFAHRTDFRFAIQDLDRSGQIIPDLYDIAFFCRVPAIRLAYSTREILPGLDLSYMDPA